MVKPRKRFEPTRLKMWERSNNYTGRDWSDWYVVVSHNRDSDLLDESNWHCATELLEAPARRLGDRRCTIKDHGQPTRCIEVATFNHWGVGWIEALCVHKDSPPSVLRAADYIARRLENYPVLDDSDYSQREFDYARDYWQRADVRERLHYIKAANDRAGEEISIFAARRPTLPESDMGGLLQMLARE